MSISPENFAWAMRRVGLAQGGPIHIDDLRRRQSDAVRLAKFKDQIERELPSDVPLPALRPFA